MTKLDLSRLELTELELAAISHKINHWKTKEKVVDLMRYRYGVEFKEQAA